ncbi:MAG TPA: hypothetical protein DIU15_00775 [Deltaproteobacteria bacterium]|nr:hypothetical protein [Deltaproteobacteria bacterium]HCP44562.1 hypothetical protein [Deltaproteobacteria bacterium]|tara:strand:- start:496 stop:1020 length:525 start_codon:yes stop_codon:yes gene_type:complete
MSELTAWNSLIDALENEIQLLCRLRDLAKAGHKPLVELDVAAVEEWVGRQRELLQALSEAGSTRGRAQDACLPENARGAGGNGPLGSTITLHALVGRAPEPVGNRLRQQGDALRQLRDEIALVTTRNEILIQQVVEFTDHFGQGLAASTQDESYDQKGQHNDLTGSGDLFSGAM